MTQLDDLLVLLADGGTTLAKLRLKPTSGRPSPLSLGQRTRGLLGETRQAPGLWAQGPKAATSKILPHSSKIEYMKMSRYIELHRR